MKKLLNNNFLIVILVSIIIISIKTIRHKSTELVENIEIQGGLKYTGYVIKGTTKPHGVGVYCFENGDCLESKFKNGKQVGTANYHFKNGLKVPTTIP